MNVDIYDGSVFSFCSQAIIKLKVLFTMNAISELSQLVLWPHLPEDHCTQRVVPPPAEWSWPTPPQLLFPPLPNDKQLFLVHHGSTFLYL